MTAGTLVKAEAAGPLAVVLEVLAADAPGTVMGAPEDWPRWAVLLPHVLAAAGHFAPVPGLQDQPGRDEASWLLDRAATYLQVHARLAEARLLAERALAITEAAYGPDHPTVGTRLNNLATIWQDLGQPEQARPLAERALAITEAAYGPGHPTVGVLRRNLTVLMQGDSGASPAGSPAPTGQQGGQRAEEDADGGA
jgi:Tetratricopeptide repeat